MGMNKGLFALAALTGMTLSAQAAVNVTTWRYDNTRQGQNTQETTLTPANVNGTTFGKLFSYTVDGYVYAQPLVVNAITVGGALHDTVFIATQHDSVFAFDAHQNLQLWKASLLDTAHGAASGATTVPSTDLGTNDIVPEIGITATPVIDPVANTLYVVSKSKENGLYVTRLHALDLATGNEKANSPVVIGGSVAGNGVGSVGGQVAFQPEWQLNRTGLMLSNGSVYIAFGAHGDNGPYHGWLFAYNATTLAQTAIFNTSPNGKGDGIWHSGAPPAADTVNGATRLFLATGNFFDTGTGAPTPTAPYVGPMNYSNTIVRADITNGGLTISDTWTPFDTVTLSANDEDQTAGGIVLLPDQTTSPTHLLVQVGKSGRVELLNRDSLGGYNTTYNAVVEEIYGPGGLWSTPAYWNNSVYFWGSNSQLQQYALNAGRLNNAATSTWTVTSAFPGASPVISSNGTANGIIWTLRTDAYNANGNAILYANDPTNVSRQFYGSDQNSARDAVGLAVKFAVPVVANGLVYAGARSQVSVYGLLAATVVPTVPTPTLTPAPGVYSNATSVSIADSLANTSIHYTTNGTAPTTASALYTGPITVSSTEQVEALAVATGYNNSSVVNGSYTIGTAPVLNFPSGFASVAGLTLNGSAINTDDSRLQLTDGGYNQAGSVFSTTAVDIRNFTSDFTFQLSGSAPLADGITFTIQAQGPTALGPSGGGLGYGPDYPGGTGGIKNSVAVKFDLYSNVGEGANSTGVYVNGASPTTPATSLTPSNITLGNGDTITAHITYDGTTLTVTLTDPVTNGSYVGTTVINIPTTIGATSAYVGFTGGTGGYTSSQKLLTWEFTSATAATAPVATAATYQAETLSPVSSGPTFRTFAWYLFPNGTGAILDATNVGDNVTFSVPFTAAGTYDLKVTSKAYFTRGTYQVSLDGVNVGGVQDGYVATEAYSTFDIGPLVIKTAGTHTIRFTVTGKDASSQGYTICMDTLTFTPQ